MKLASGSRFLYVYIIAAITAFQVKAALSQEVQPDTLRPLPIRPAVIRSAVLPGWGQIFQERLVPGMAYYVSSAIFYYRAFYNFDRFRKNDRSVFRKRGYQNLGIALLSHVVSVSDAALAGVFLKPVGWQGSLLGDKPLKSPWGATLRSAILPGWGQIYNETYVKAALYFAIDGYLVYKIREADRNYASTGIGKFKDRRSRYSWYFGLAYLITLMDAQVGAYLYRFDDAMKLAVSPSLIHENPGIRIYVAF